MISVPTTFVVGAGGSEPYGLPLGGSLLESARRLKDTRDEYGFVRQLCERRHQSITAEHLNEFVKDIQRTRVKSIDTFLEMRSFDSRKMIIGRTVIAALMARALLVARNHHVNEEKDWLDYLAVRMQSGARTGQEFIECNHVRFVTFNFDS